MGKHNCAVIGCTNSSYQLDKWRNNPCAIHAGQNHDVCGCELPYRLYCFPGPKRFAEQRERWIRCVKRVTKDKKPWYPCSSDRVCSEHFVDGIPTEKNPDPSLKMGYELPEQPTSRRSLVKQPLAKKPKVAASSSICNEGQELETASDSSSLIIHECGNNLLMKVHDTKCDSCEVKASIILTLSKEIEALRRENDFLHRKISAKQTAKATFSHCKIKTDKKMNFYTGISSIPLFNIIFSLLSPYMPKLKYWRGRKTTCSVKRQHLLRPKLIPQKDEFLLVLMRLRLGLLNEDVADRFGISTATASNIFTTWIRLLSKVLGHCMLAWLPRESIREHLPAIFQKTGHSNTRCIIDCSEVFIERPKSLLSQAATWSDYKSHNTLKFLLAISPNGFITFVSSCYGGRASDKFICSDSGFYDLLEYGDEVMADRGFQIQEELMLRFCHISVPPGARTKSQMTPKECKKRKNIANLRIHVERAINRIKSFRILKSPLPITMTFHADDIIRTCSALCNFKPPLVKLNKS